MLALAVITLFVVSFLIFTVLMVTTASLHQNQLQQSNSIALNLAESGAEVAALWLKKQSYPPAYTSAFDPFGGARALGNGTYQVTIYPDPSNSTQFLKIFRVVSTGTFSHTTKNVEIVLRQASFGRYAYFTDKETSTVSGGAIWWRTGERVDGPVHSNNRDGSNFNINYVGSNSPIFLDMVTASGSSINYDPKKPRGESDFKKIFNDGTKGYKLGVPPIALPDSTDSQKLAALGSTSNYPSSTGVYIRSDLNGGIYIVGDAGIELSVDSSGSQKLTIKQVVSGTTRTTTVTLNKNGTTTASGPVGAGSPTSSSWPTNGVVYCTGNITSLKGTVADNTVASGQVTQRSALTIATDVNAGKDVTITDNLVYKTRPNKTLDDDASVNLAAGTLGVVARNIKVSSSAPRNLSIDAVLMAGGNNTSSGSFYVENYDTKSTGTLTLLGGVIQKARGPVGTFNPSTGTASSGYAKNYSYDPRLANYPPPFFPTTGTYERLSWQVLPD